jgi:hypothetical protein
VSPLSDDELAEVRDRVASLTEEVLASDRWLLYACRWKDGELQHQILKKDFFDLDMREVLRSIRDQTIADLRRRAANSVDPEEVQQLSRLADHFGSIQIT